METALHILTGGFLKSYRTYVLMALAFVTAIVGWSVGDMDTSQFLTFIFTTLGLGTSANHTTPEQAKAIEVVEEVKVAKEAVDGPSA